MHRGKISEEEIGAAGQYLQGVEAKCMESPAEIENRMIDFKLIGLSPNSFFSYIEDINKLAARDVRQAEGRYLSPERNVIIMLGQGSEVEAQLQSLNETPNFVS